MGTAIPLARLEEIIDASGVAPAIEAMLPVGVRQRQLHPRTLLVGMQLALTDRRPAHLTEVHAALTSLPRADQERLGVTADWHGGPHRLTYRQVEHTHRIINRALAKDQPDGAPSPRLQHVRPADRSQHPRGVQEHQHLNGRRLDRRGGLGTASAA